MQKYLFLLLAVVIVAGGCAEFKGSPFTDILTESKRNWNAVNITKIQNLGLTDQFKIALISDTHSNYNDLRDVINVLNARSDIDFVIHVGDFTNQGYNYEYDYFIEAMEKLRKPFVVVIGNHDSVGKGPSLYRQAFGAENFTIEFAKTKFIFANNNRLDFIDEGWNAQWLEDQVQNSQAKYDNLIVVHHVDAANPYYFNEKSISDFNRLYSDQGVNWVVNGHLHTFNITAHLNYKQLTVPRVENGQYNVMEFTAGGTNVWYCQLHSCEQISR